MAMVSLVLKLSFVVGMSCTVVLSWPCSRSQSSIHGLLHEVHHCSTAADLEVDMHMHNHVGYMHPSCGFYTKSVEKTMPAPSPSLLLAEPYLVSA